MPKLPALSCKDLLRILKKAGFDEHRQKGSHIILRKGGVRVVIPCHGNRDLKKGTALAILEQAGISSEDAIKLL
ncbi:MAG: type II toxin-antitoxin system HicA family toxin [Nitrospinae bacterium]|nr:type II toxin-antitoxin system HicA family toxin [Nitrospinota bacterium]